jgi:hypothetical protein
VEASLAVGYIQGEGRNQATLAMTELGFERAKAAETGRPGFDRRDLLKLYLYGYLNQIRSSRRLEIECRRNIELMWVLGRLYPDHKSIAELRRMHRDSLVCDCQDIVATLSWRSQYEEVADCVSEGLGWLLFVCVGVWTSRRFDRV